MKVAAISDVHGNHYALAEVLRIAKSEGAEKLLVLGDCCGYYYHPETVLEQIRTWDFIMIRGNHERMLLELQEGKITESQLRKKYGSGHRMALEKLKADDLNTMCLAPDQFLAKVGNLSILMCHGSPVDKDQYLYPDADKALLEKCDVKNADLVLVGHSHYPFVFRNKFSTLINIGSVGQSRSMGGVASWLMINTSNGVFEAKSTPYSTEQLEQEVTEIDPDIPYLIDILKRNRK